MGFLVAAEPRPVFNVVATVAGKGTVRGRTVPRARLYVLEDRTAVLCLPAESGKGVDRETLLVDTSSWSPSTKMLTVTGYTEESLAEEQPLPVVFMVDGRGCGCGLGAVGNAGPVVGKYQIERVRAPEWHTVT